MGKEEEDYAGRAVREGFNSTKAEIRLNKGYEESVEELAVIIRKQVDGEILPCGCQMAMSDCKAR